MAGVAAAGAAVTGLLFAGYRTIRQTIPFAADSSRPLESLCAAAVLGAVVALLAVWWTRRRYHRLLEKLAEHVADLRQNPAVHGLHELDRLLPSVPALTAVQEQVQALTTCYRRALAEVVQAQEALDERRSNGRDSEEEIERPTPPRPAHPISGSSRRRLVARLARDLHWMTATPSLLQWLGCAIADLTGRSFLDVVHPGDVPEVGRVLQEALREGGSRSVTFRVAALDQDERYLHVEARTSYTDKSDPPHLRCHFFDVTDLVRTKRELQGRTVELEETRALLDKTNDDLQRLKESYRDLYNHAPVLYFGLDATGRFVAVNETMLRSLGYSREELLGQSYLRLLTPAGREFVLQNPAALQRPGEWETQWLKKDGTILDVRIDTTILRDERGAFVRSRGAALDVSERKRLSDALHAKDEVPRGICWDETLQTIRGDLHELIQHRQAVVRVEEPLPPVCGDPERVRELLSHLIGNGLKHNDNVHPEVVVGATAVPEAPLRPGKETRKKADFATLFVRDNGNGIDPKRAEGVGLATCRRIVEAYGGRMWIESQAGQGATFYFTLPRGSATEDRPPAPSVVDERRIAETAPVA
jgi:PAS domain S-box-containing protein